MTKKILFTAMLISCLGFSMADMSRLLPARAWAASTSQRETKTRDREIPIPVRSLLKRVKTAMDKEDWSAVIGLVGSAKTRAGGPDSAAPCTDPLICLALGNSHLMRGDHGPAEAAYLAALDRDPGFMDARINLAKVYADSRRYAKASETFLAAYKDSDPKNGQFLYYAGAMALMDGQASEAVKRFSTLFSVHPDLVTLQWKETFANALMTAKFWKRALPQVRELCELTRGETRIKWQETLLQIYLTLDDKHSALKLATTLSRQAPGEARWWKALVHIRLGLEDYRNALDDMIIYGFVTPLSPKEKKLLADLSLQLQIPARAAGIYEEILSEAEPRTAKEKRELIRRLVNALRQTGRTDRALALLDGIDPELSCPDLMLLKGDLLYEEKKFKAADTAYRLAAEGEFPLTGQAWLMAGYSAWQYNDFAASKNAFQRAARYKKHRKDALAAMARLERTAQM